MTKRVLATNPEALLRRAERHARQRKLESIRGTCVRKFVRENFETVGQLRRTFSGSWVETARFAASEGLRLPDGRSVTAEALRKASWSVARDLADGVDHALVNDFFARTTHALDDLAQIGQQEAPGPYHSTSAEERLALEHLFARRLQAHQADELEPVLPPEINELRAEAYGPEFTPIEDKG
jgi:hypothetical protein